jgi:hypothetical protein
MTTKKLLSVRVPIAGSGTFDLATKTNGPKFEDLVDERKKLIYSH